MGSTWMNSCKVRSLFLSSLIFLIGNELNSVCSIQPYSHTTCNSVNDKSHFTNVLVNFAFISWESLASSKMYTIKGSPLVYRFYGFIFLFYSLKSIPNSIPSHTKSRNQLYDHLWHAEKSFYLSLQQTKQHKAVSTLYTVQV